MIAFLALCCVLLPGSYAYEPSPRQGETGHGRPAYDVWGTPLSAELAARKRRTEAGRRELSPAEGAVAIDLELLRLGRATFYTETFGNEVFLTDVLGITAGPLTLPAFARALARLGGRGTRNLRVELARDVNVGGRFFRAGMAIDTGLDVAAGAHLPLGIKLTKLGMSIKIGVTCAACHSTVDPESHQVIDGAPNTDLNAGWLLAMATNSAALFLHTDVGPLASYVRDPSTRLRDSRGQLVTLPDAGVLEEAVDATLLQWPRGSFDSMLDEVSAPTQVPDAFTYEEHPYGASGAFMAGPFRGLSAQSNALHGFSADPFAQADASAVLFGIDKEPYLAVLLQNAANARYRYRPASRAAPSAFFAAVDPTPQAPGLGELVVLPAYPRVTLLAANSLWNSSPGLPVSRQVNAVSAWQNTLVAPAAPLPREPARVEHGRRTFERAGCAACHAGPAFTNHRVIAVNEIGTQPLRARSLQRTERLLAGAMMYAFDQPVPLPDAPRTLPVPIATLDPKEIQLAFAREGSRGGYKVAGLLGLYWSAPYLHDGGVAVGPNLELDLGVSGTLQRGVEPDAALSLHALFDRRLRARVVRANQADLRLRRMHVTGQGHEFWVDETAGFSLTDRAALVHYLLTLRAGH